MFPKKIYILYLILWYTFTLISAIYTKLYLNETNNEFTFTLVTFGYGFALKLLTQSTDIKGFLFSSDKNVLLDYIYLSILNIGGLLLTNVSINQTSVTVVYISKALEPILVIIFSYIFLEHDYDIKIKLSLIQILCGVLLSIIIGKIEYSIYGLIVIFFANLSTASRSVFYKLLFKGSNYHHSVYTFYLNISFLSFLIFLPFWLMLTLIGLKDKIHIENHTLIYLIIGTAFNFLYNLLSFIILKNVSSITHSIMNIMKRVFVVLGSILFFSSKLTYIQFSGIIIADFGCLIYSYLKSTIQTKTVKTSNNLKKYFKYLIISLVSFLIFLCFISKSVKKDPIKLTLYYYRPFYNNKWGENFGDTLSFELLKRMVGENIKAKYKVRNTTKERKLLAIGSIIHYAEENDVIWGSGSITDKPKYLFINNTKVSRIDVRAVRGPKTRDVIMKNFNISVPTIYGDPALLTPYFFPEFKKTARPLYKYLVIPHIASPEIMFPKRNDNIIWPTEKWNVILSKIVQSELVLSSSLHGIIVAESFGIPARMLNIRRTIKSLFKYDDYYHGTGRDTYTYATSIEEGLNLGGEKKFVCDLNKLYQAFPKEFFGNNILHSTLPKLSENKNK